MRVKSIYILKMSQREQQNDSTPSNASLLNTAGQTNDGEPSTESGSNNRTDLRVMRCFCGCTELTYEEIEHITMMSIQSLIHNSTGNTLFKNFLRIGHRIDKSEAMEHLEFYEMCDAFLQNRQLIRDLNFIDDFLSLCPYFHWEERINNVIENNDVDQTDQQLQLILNDFKRECIHSIECHNDYDRFRREMLRKIGRL